MLHDEKNLKDFGKTIQNLIMKTNLSRNQVKQCFRQILCNEQPELHQGAFLAALVAKGETAEEIAGAWEAICQYDTIPVNRKLPDLLMENSGTGMDPLKTFNVSTAAALIASSLGISMARHGARALTSSCGTVDILESLGINVDCPVDKTAQSILKAGIGIFNGMSPGIHPGGLFRILSQIRFGSTLNIAASLASPVCPTHGVRGVYAPEKIKPVVSIMQSIGYEQGLVLHGFDARKKPAHDELSILGPSNFCFFRNDMVEIEEEITPKDFGLDYGKYEDIAPKTTRKEETERFLQVIAGKSNSSCLDMVALNAGAIIYTSGLKETFKESVSLSRETLAYGKALKALRKWVETQSYEDSRGIKIFEEQCRNAGVFNLT